MTKKITLPLFTLLFISAIDSFSMPPQQQSAKRFELFIGAGYWNPSMKQWNDGIEALNKKLITTYYQSDSKNPGTFTGGNYLDFGVKYHLTPDLHLILSIGHLQSDVSTYYFGTYDVDGSKPLCTIRMNDRFTYSHQIRLNPALFDVAYRLPFLGQQSPFSFYVGGGLGYYFSTLQNEVKLDMNDAYLYRETTVDTVIDLNIRANLKTNANPLGYHLMTGFDFNYGIIKVNIELGYHFAQAKINDEDWTYFTQKYQYQLPDYAEFDYKCFETTLFQIDRKNFDDVRLKKIDYSGILVKGSIALYF